MEQYLLDILNEFALDGSVVSIAPFGGGYINQTMLVTTDSGRRYVFQRISENTFHDVDGLMNNIMSVTEFLKAQCDDPRTYMHFLKTRDGRSYYRASTGAYRIYEFIEDTICLETPETDRDFYESAVGFGRFQANLVGFPAETLVEVIKNFHNTVDRYRIFKEVLSKDPMGRAKDVQREIDFVLSREDEMSELQWMRESGALPVRVTHNDTKLNNVLLDSITRKAICVIDLDTVMPGLSAYDFGDSIRFGAATASENELDLSRMEMNLNAYEIFTRGFVGELKGLSKEEIMSFPLGAKIITMEQGLRFLNDYIDGDHYYGSKYETQNLDRARTQFKLVTDMDRKWDQMRFIVEKYI